MRSPLQCSGLYVKHSSGNVRNEVISGPPAMNVPPGAISSTIDDLPTGRASPCDRSTSAMPRGSRSVPVRHQPDASSFGDDDLHAATSASIESAHAAATDLDASATI